MVKEGGVYKALTKCKSTVNTEGCRAQGKDGCIFNEHSGNFTVKMTFEPKLEGGESYPGH